MRRVEKATGEAIMQARTLIVGGGMGGTIVANGLARRLSSELRAGDASITVLGTTPKHMYQPGLLYMPFGRAREQELCREERSILDRKINFAVDPATRIDVDNNRVEARSGKTYEYDYLVIATGSALAPEVIPGLSEGAHQFYDLPGARKLRDAIDALMEARSSSTSTRLTSARWRLWKSP